MRVHYVRAYKSKVGQDFSPHFLCHKRLSLEKNHSRESMSPLHQILGLQSRSGFLAPFAVPQEAASGEEPEIPPGWSQGKYQESLVQSGSTVNYFPQFHLLQTEMLEQVYDQTYKPILTQTLGQDTTLEKEACFSHLLRSVNVPDSINGLLCI